MSYFNLNKQPKIINKFSQIPTFSQSGKAITPKNTKYQNHLTLYNHLLIFIFPSLFQISIHIQNIISILLMEQIEQRRIQSIPLSQQFLRNLIIQQQQCLADYQIHPSIIQHKYKLESINQIIDDPTFKELTKRIEGVKSVFVKFQIILNDSNRTIYKQRQASYVPSSMINQTILSKFTSILNEYKQTVLQKMNILPIYLTKQHNFQQQIKFRSRIIYEQQKQKAIVWQQQVKGQQRQMIISEKGQEKAKLQSLKAIIGTYYKTVKINFDKKEIKFGELDKTTSQFQGMIAHKKDLQFVLSIGRWKGEQPKEIITINYVPVEQHQQPFLIYRKYKMKQMTKSIVWFIEDNVIKEYNEKQQVSSNIPLN